MKYLFFVLSVTSVLFGCQMPQKQVEAKLETTQSINYSFPKHWEGEWIGQVQIYSGKNIKQEIAMELHILPIDTSERYTFTIIYGEDKEKGKRPYELFAVDTIIGHYKIDEKNGIILDAYLFDNKILSRFEVMGNMLLSSYERTSNAIKFEIISGNTNNPILTGGLNDSIPEVKSYPIKIRQKAILRKK